MPKRHSGNRRAHARLSLRPMYTAVTARRRRGRPASLCGHVYDISQAGLRIELDEPLQPDESVTLRLDLPAAGTVNASARVVWVSDGHDDPGPRRAALRFTRFATPADRAGLARLLASNCQTVAPRGPHRPTPVPRAVQRRA